MAVVATLAFGTGFYLIGAIREMVRFRTFLVNLVAQTLLLAMAILIPSVIVSWVAIAASARASMADPKVIHAMLSFFARSGPTATIRINTLIGLSLSFSCPSELTRASRSAEK